MLITMVLCLTTWRRHGRLFFHIVCRVSGQHKIWKIQAKTHKMAAQALAATAGLSAQTQPTGQRSAGGDAATARERRAA
eukprot:SAG22_NODE_2075_length_3046_cov_2.125212_1_plen_78_part_10